MDQTIPDAGALRCIVYASRANDLWSDADLAQLVERARAKNSRHRITGCITYRHRQFAATMEGPAPAVEALFSTIERDVRHRDLRVLLRRNVTSRAFADWSIAAGDEGDAAAWSVLAGLSSGPLAGADLAWTELNEILPEAVPPVAGSIRQPTQQARAHDTVQRLLQSTQNILLKGGLSALSVPRLAEAAGVSQPTFYRYFANIEALLSAILLRVALRRMEDWAAVIDAHAFSSDASLADLLCTLGTQNFMKIGGVPPALAHALLPRLAMASTEIAGALSPAVLRAIARGNLAPGMTLDETAMVALLSGMLNAMISMASLDADRLRSEDIRRTAAGMLLGGLRASCRPTAP